MKTKTTKKKVAKAKPAAKDCKMNALEALLLLLEDGIASLTAAQFILEGIRDNKLEVRK